MADHTPGPWVAVFAEDGGYDCMTDAFRVRSEKDQNMITELDCNSYGQKPCSPLDASTRDIVQANANLIASAPDLLMACEMALNDRMYKDWPSIADALMAAIVKAKGSI